MSAIQAQAIAEAGPTLLKNIASWEVPAEGQKAFPEDGKPFAAEKPSRQRAADGPSEAEPVAGASALVGGWAVCPALLEFGDKLLGPLKQGPKLPAELAAEAGMAQGSLSLTLRVCASLGYVGVDSATGLCSLAAGQELWDLDRYLQASPALAASIRSLYAVAAPPFRMTSEEVGHCLRAWEQHRAERKKVESQTLLQALDGAVLTPLLASLAFFTRWNEHGVELSGEGKEQVDLGAADAEEGEALGEVLEDVLKLGALDLVDSFEISEEGREALERVRAQLLEISSSSLVLRRLTGASDEEPPPALTAAQNSMMRVGQELARQAHLGHLAGVLRGAFDGGDVETQPRYLAMEASADGVLLKQLHQYIREHTARGKVLGEHPLVIIGVLPRQESIADLRSVLRGAGVPHILVSCDPHSPAQLRSELSKQDVDLASVLHVRWCAGGLLEVEAPPCAAGARCGAASRKFAEAQLAGLPLHDERQQACMAPPDVLASLVGHFEHWGAALQDSRGLCLLERVAPGAAGAGETPVDACAARCLSGQHLVPAALSSLAAAMAGLLPASVRAAEEHYDAATRCAVLGRHLVRRDFRVRLAEASDIESLLELEEASWAEHHRGSREVLLRRLETSPTTNFVCTKGGKVVAVLYTQRIDDKAAVDRQTIFEVSDGHVPGGRFLQLVAVAADAGSGGVGSELRAFALHLARLDPTIESVIAVTLARGFKRFGGSMQEYVDKHARGELFDPIIGFHTSFGAQVRRLVHGYRPKDLENQGIGVLIEYDIASMEGVGGAQATLSGAREVGEGAAQETEKPARADAQKKAGTEAAKVSMLELVSEEVRNLGYEVDEENLSRGLLDLGLDSVDANALKKALGSKLGLHLTPMLIFDHPSVQALSEELERLAPAQAEESAQAGGARSPSPRAAGAPKPSMTQLIVDCVREMGFQVDEGSLWRGFMDIGLDSVEVGALRATLNSKLGLHLNPTLMFDHPSIETLGKELGRLVGEEEDEEAAAEEAEPEAMDETALKAAIKAKLDGDIDVNLLSDGSFLQELSGELDGLLRAKEARAWATAEGPKAPAALAWDAMTCSEVESVQRALIGHFRRPAVRHALLQKREACAGNRLKYLFVTDPIVDAGHAEVLQRLGLLEGAGRDGLRAAQEKLGVAVLQYWGKGEVRALTKKLKEALGRSGRDRSRPPAQSPAASDASPKVRSLAQALRGPLARAPPARAPPARR